MIRKLRLIILAAIASTKIFAQTDADALKYTVPFIGSTARSMGTGGAFGAIGADFSNLSTNPAGLGLYRKSEILFSPSIQTTTKNASYFNNNTIDSKSTLNLQNWGMVFTYKLGKDDNLPEWKYVNFGIGMNKYNILSSSTFIVGNNNLSSIGDFFVKQANGINPENLNGFQSGLAYNSFFLNLDKNIANNYVCESKGNVLKKQSKYINNIGSIGETVFSLSANYANKWFWGGTIGISKINYSETSTFTESDEKNLSGNFKSLTYTEKLTTKGVGVNLKLGTIYKPADWIRLGLAVHTPTSFGVTDYYSATMTTRFDTTENKTWTADNANGYDYSLITPARFVGSLGFIIGKYGFITFENEWLNYKQMHFKPNVDLYSANQLIKTKYTQANNLKIGLEINLSPYSIRIGYANIANAFNKNVNSNNKTQNFTLGAGFRNQNLFFDMALVLSQSQADRYYVYSAEFVPSAKITTQKTIFVSSIGFKF